MLLRSGSRFFPTPGWYSGYCLRDCKQRLVIIGTVWDRGRREYRNMAATAHKWS